MKRETFIAILSAVLAEADEELWAEAKQQVEARGRSLRMERVQEYEPGQEIDYIDALGGQRRAPIHKLNLYSVTVHQPHPTEGYTPIVVDINRVLSPGTKRRPF